MEDYLGMVKKTVINHFNVLSETYDEKAKKRRDYLNTIDLLILNELIKENRMCILDVGCGTGSRSEKLNLNGSQIYGCDISSKMLGKAIGKKIDGLVLADMTRLPFREESFNVILCLFNVIGYLSNQKERITVLTEFNKILKDGGLLFIDFMNRWHLGEGLSFKRSLFTAIKIYLQSTIASPVFRGNMFFDLTLNGSKVKGFVHGFSENEIKFLFTEANFSILNRVIIGYDSGNIKFKKSQGQFFYIAKKCHMVI